MSRKRDKRSHASPHPIAAPLERADRTGAGERTRGRAAEEPAAVGAEHADRAALALWLTLVVLAASHAALTFVPGTWFWSLNLGRFLPPIAGWGPWLVAALALVPPVARPLSRILGAWGDALSRRPWSAIGVCMVAAAGLAWLNPDRVRFVGDFLLRQGTVEVAEQPGLLFPQALPLDVLLHYVVPLKLTAARLLTANGAARVLGAVEAASLAALAVVFVRTLELRGGAAIASAAVVFFGGYLGMFTGFSKAFAEMCVLMAIVGVSGMAAVRTGRGLFAAGAAVAVGITLHRSALGMLPALGLIWGLWLRRHGANGGWRRPWVLIAALPPLVALAVMMPRIAGTILHTDTAVHFLPPEVVAQGGALGAALAGTRPFDFASLVLMLSPLAVAIPLLAGLLAPAVARIPERAREPLVLAVLALPFVGIMVFIHPAQGLYRDWDDFAATGVALSLLAAWLVGETLRSTRRFGWLTAAVVLGVAAPAAQWLLVHADTTSGIARVRAFVLEPPPRSPAQRGVTWDYLGIRNFRLQRYPEAQEAFAHAAETSPSPRILQQWALAATLTNDLTTAQAAYHRLLVKQPDNELGWLGLLAVSVRRRDLAEAERAAHELLRIEPNHSEAQRALREIAQYRASRPDSARGATPREGAR